MAPTDKTAWTVGRLHYLDNLRAFLMLLGVPYHAALAYSVLHGWMVVSENEKSVLLSWASQFSHTFRMPAFFLIAGFFAALLLRRKGALPWWRNRMLRIGVPMITAALLLNPLMMLAMALDRGGAAGAEGVGEAFWALFSVPGEPWVAHLWFLFDLLIYCSLLALAWRFIDHVRARRVIEGAEAFAGRFRLGYWLLLPIAGCASLGAVMAFVVLDINSTAYGMLVLARTAGHAPAFLFGALLACYPQWLQRFTTIHWPSWVLAFALAVTLCLVQSQDQDLPRAMKYFLMPLVGIMMSHVLMSAMRKWLDWETPLTRGAVDGAFTIYLFHQVFIVFGVLLLRDTGLPALVQFTLLTIGSLLLSLGVHLVIRRHPLLLMLFNGVPPRQRAARLHQGRTVSQHPGQHHSQHPLPP
ncbi:acyltransferase family protein [Teichococcus oryzae]|nr:acyltransferase family protein [Pseudoroseomonas oryzae]